jgi:hypothetical protein
MAPMTERRRARFRRRSSDHLVGGAGIAVLLGVALVIGVDAANRGGLLAGGGFGLDGNRTPDIAAQTTTTRSTPGRVSLASILPGEIVVEAAGDLPEGTWSLGGKPMSAPPVVLDSVSAGEHQLSFSGRDSVSWNTNVSLEPGGIAHVVVPELAPSSAATAMGRVTAPEDGAQAASAPVTTEAPAPVVPTPPAPADSTQQL